MSSVSLAHFSNLAGSFQQDLSYLILFFASSSTDWLASPVITVLKTQGPINELCHRISAICQGSDCCAATTFDALQLRCDIALVAVEPYGDAGSSFL
jgi:hypothetical protein